MYLIPLSLNIKEVIPYALTTILKTTLDSTTIIMLWVELLKLLRRGISKNS